MIIEEMNGHGGGTLRLRDNIPSDLIRYLGDRPNSWVLQTPSYPGAGMAMTRSAIAELCGEAGPVGGMVQSIAAGEISLEGWASILTTRTDQLDIGLAADWWHSHGPRNSLWWAQRVAGRALDADVDEPFDVAEGTWVDVLVDAPSSYGMATTGGAWKTRIDGLNQICAILNMAWTFDMTPEGRPRLRTFHLGGGAYSQLGQLRWWLVSANVPPGHYPLCPLFGAVRDVMAVGGANLSFPHYEGVYADSAVAIDKDGNGFGDLGPALAVDIDGYPLQRVALTSAPPEVDLSNNKQAAAQTAKESKRGMEITARLDIGIHTRDMPHVGGAIVIHDPTMSFDLGQGTSPANMTPSIAVGAQIVPMVPLWQCLRREIPTTATTGVWHIDMSPGAEQQVTDLTPFIEPEDDSTTIVIGDRTRPDIRSEILGKSAGISIVGF